MALDGITLSFIRDELVQNLTGAKVEKIYQPSKCELVFLMRTRAGAFRLYMSCQAISPRIHITQLSYENPQKPPMLCMLFRKRLVGATLKEINQVSLDRILELVFDASNEIGDRETLKLYIEIMAQRSNIVLTDADDTVIDAVKRVDETKSTYREVLPGGKYLLPPEQNKLNIVTNSNEEILETVRHKNGKKLSDAILSSVLGVSPVVCRELAYRSAGDDIPTDEITGGVLLKLGSEISGIRQQIINSEPDPQAVYDSDGQPVDFSFTDITQYGNAFEIKRFDSFSLLLDAFCEEKDRAARIKHRAGDLFKIIGSAKERITKKINLQTAELEKCADREKLRIYAELINSNLYRLEKGSVFYDIENYYDSNNVVRIPVNPAFTPVQNSQKYYKEYRKAATAEKMLGDLIAGSRDELEYLDSVLDELSRADTEQDIAEIRAELSENGYLRRRSKEKIKLPKTLAPYEFTTSDGFKVLVGRNNAQNDKLTFRQAKNYDMWLHVQSFAGSHTLIISDNREITDRAIEEAAKIAARFSSADGNVKIPVDYTLVKNLKKPPDSKPGKVIYHIYNTIYVNPEKE